MSTTNSHTEVKQVETTLASILGSPTGENVITPPKNNVFKNTTHTSLSAGELQKAAADKAAKDKEAADLKAKEEADRVAAEKLAKDKEGKTPEEIAALEEAENKRKELAAKNTTTSTKSLIQELTEQEKEEEEIKKTGGRPPVTKDALISGIEKRIKDKTFLELDGVEKPLKEYTEEELWEVIDLNIDHKQKEVADEVPAAFFDALPPELQTAFTYLENLRGAKGSYSPEDVQHILKVVTTAVNITNLDISNEDGQEEVVRTFLASTNFGTPEEIDEEVSGIKDRGELEKKAGQFKPKLDAAQKAKIEKDLKATEQARKKAEAQAGKWMDTVYKALEADTVGGIKVNNKDKTSLYNSLVQVNYPSFTGTQTNKFGYLIESRQFGKEQDLEAVFLAQMILEDKKGTLEKLRGVGAAEKVTEVAKKLKIEQDNKGTHGHQQEEMAGANRNVK